MQLQPIPVSSTTAAENTARQIITQVTQLAQRVSAIRKVGVPAIPERPARQAPNGQMIPVQPSQPAITPEQLADALGTDNTAVLDALSSVLGINTES